MYYKQLLLSAAICLSSATTLFAQYGAEETNTGFYIKAGAEYSIPMLQSTGLKSVEYVLDDQNMRFLAYKYQKISFGKGIWPSLNIGYFFTPNFGFDVGVAVNALNAKYKSENTDLGFSRAVTIKTETPVLLTPSLTYRLPFDKISILGKTGVVIPVNTNIMESSEDNVYSETAEYKNRFTVGISCSLGFEYQFTKHLAAALEVNAVALTVHTQERSISSYKINGVETIDKVPEQSKTIHYEYEHNASVNSREPIPFSFSRAGLRIGLAYYF